MTGVRWDVGEELALASDVPQFGLDTYAPAGVDWSKDTSWIAQAAIDAAFDAGGGEVVVPNLGRTYRWHEVNVRSQVGLRFLGHPRVQSNSPVGAAGRMIKFEGSESDTMSLLTSDHPLPTLTVSTASWSAAVATITTTAAHNLVVGDEVVLLRVSPAGYNGLFVVTATPSSTQFSYAKTSDPGSYVSGGVVDVMPYVVHPASASGFAAGDVVMVASDTYLFTGASAVNVTNAVWDSGTGIVTLTFASAIGAVVGDPVEALGISSSGPGSFNGVFTIISKTSTTLTYKLQNDPGTYSSGGTAQLVEGQDLELNKILSITGNSVLMERPLMRTYATSDRARLIKLDACEDSYIVGPVSLTIPIGGDGGGMWWNYAYNCGLQDVDVYGSAGRPAMDVLRSGKIRLDRWGTYDGQNLASGSGIGYGLAIGQSAHDVRASNGFSSHVRENNLTNNVMDIVWDNNHILWTYSSALNTHGSGCKRVRFENNHVEVSQGVGIGVGNGDSTHVPDEDVEIVNNDIYTTGDVGLDVFGHSDGTKPMKRVRVRGNRIYGTRRNASLQVKYSEDVEVEGNRVEGIGAESGQAMIYVHHASDIAVNENRIRGGGSDYGIRWDTVTNLEMTGNKVKDCASYNLWGVNSSGVTLGPTVMDDTDVSLEGTEMLVGSESLAGALQATPPDADLTPDPVYRYHVWSISAARTVHAPSAGKRVVGQRITFDITNTGLVLVTPAWDGEFVLAAPFHLKAA